MRGLDGKPHRVGDWQGKVIVLNFWASWCPSCLYEIQDFVKYQRQYGDKGLQIVGIGMDDEQKLRNVQRTLEINYPILVAPRTSDDDMLRAWGNRSGVVPYSVVLDRAGQVVSTYRGVMEAEEFENIVGPLLRDRNTMLDAGE